MIMLFHHAWQFMTNDQSISQCVAIDTNDQAISPYFAIDRNDQSISQCFAIDSKWFSYFTMLCNW